MMKAAWFERFGPARKVLQVGEQPKPRPGPGEVLVRLHASGVNPSDVKKRAGAFPDLLDNGLVIPNSDGAGVIEAVGPDVAESRIGERVWVYQAQFQRRFGTAAEYVSLESRRAVPLPENTPFDIGACIGIPVMTAHRCVFADGPVEGLSVLVTGGAGRVGHYAVQWASEAGARVITTASTPEDEQACLEVGAWAVVNHRSEGWGPQVVEANGDKRVDRVIDVDFGANLPEVLQCLRTGGVIATYSSTREPRPTLPFLDMMYMDLTLHLVIVYAMPEAAKQEAISDIGAALRGERLVHRVAHRLPLDDIATANELIEQGGFRGCVVLEMP